MTAIAATPARAGTGRSRFYIGINLLLLGIVIAGFSRSYFLSAWLAPEQPALTPLFRIHGAIATTWFLIMVLQPTLIATGRVALHRYIGWFAAGLAALLMVTGLAAGIAAMQRGFVATPIDPRRFFAVPFSNALLFAGLVGAGVAARKRGDWHKRWMLLASAAIIDAPVGRLFPFADHGLLPILAAPLLVVAAGIIHDLATRGRIHRAWPIGGGIILFVHLGRIALMFSATWVAFADWVMRSF
jgi:hypothetical protein